MVFMASLTSKFRLDVSPTPSSLERDDRIVDVVGDKAAAQLVSQRTARLANNCRCTSPQKRSRSVVRRYVDITVGCSHHRLVSKKTRLANLTRAIDYRQEIAMSVGADDTSTGTATSINVMVIVGVHAKPVFDTLAQLAAENATYGLAVNVFGDVAALPAYSETLDRHRTPDSVAALRRAATQADAILMLTSYRGTVPTTVHNAIDWLTRRWNQGCLHDKPLAVIGRAAGCYSGVWSHYPPGQFIRTPGARVVEPITVENLGEAIQKLAGEVERRSEPSS
jgi:NAD(P)H-dependent FMN reductase